MKAAFIGGLIVHVLLTLLAGVALMFAVDIANDEWLTQMPGLGWWDATIIAILLRVALLIPSIGSKD